MQDRKSDNTNILAFLAITLFYFFEFAQMSYFAALAPAYLQAGIHGSHIGALSAAYYYGDVVGLLPVGVLLDRLPFRQVLLWAIAGSVCGAFLLLISDNFYLQWVARFICGFFGGTFSFIAGIRLIAALFSERFSYFMGLFLAAGMAGGMLCLSPLLMIVHHFGIQAAMLIMACFGIVVMLVNLVYLHPTIEVLPKTVHKKAHFKIELLRILKNYRNWFDCLLVVMLDTPVNIIGTLWGIVIVMQGFNLSDMISSYVIVSLFAGLIIGLPLCGKLADRYHQPRWTLLLGSVLCFAILIVLLTYHHLSSYTLAILFFGLGFFSSIQTQVFTWLTKNMKPEWIGFNSGLNSMVLMVFNGGFKQIAAAFMVTAPLLWNTSPVLNILLFVAICFLLAIVYLIFRRSI